MFAGTNAAAVLLGGAAVLGSDPAVGDGSAGSLVLIALITAAPFGSAVIAMHEAVLHLLVSGLRLLETPGDRVVPVGPEWLMGGAWGMEAGVATATALIGITFLLLQLPRAILTSTAPVLTRPPAALEDAQRNE